MIFFSDILTPLPALGIEFDVIKGKGPVISNPVRDMDAVRALRTLDDPTKSLAFTGETLSALRRAAGARGARGRGGGVRGRWAGAWAALRRVWDGGGRRLVPAGTNPAGACTTAEATNCLQQLPDPPPCRREVDGQATLLGFVGTPWTLAAYAMEGKADRDCKQTKTIMLHHPAVLHAFLEHLTNALITYVGYQIESGAQVVQLFDSWAHHLSPSQFEEFSLPYANRVTEAVRAKYPHVPIIFHANGGARGRGGAFQG